MMRFLKQHEDWVLGGTAVILATLIILLMIWSVSRLSRDLSLAANGPDPGSGANTFNMEAAKALDFKGLGQ